MTQRTKADLDTLFADNSAGLITPARLRDFVESAACSDGSLYVSTPIATAISVAGDFVKAAGTTTFVDGHRVTMPSNNRLLYSGDALIHAHVTCALSLKCADDAQELAVAVAKNGVVLTHSTIEQFMVTGANAQSVALAADCDLEDGDYLEIWVTNNTDTQSVTLQRAYMALAGNMCE